VEERERSRTKLHHGGKGGSDIWQLGSSNWLHEVAEEKWGEDAGMGGRKRKKKKGQRKKFRWRGGRRSHLRIDGVLFIFKKGKGSEGWLPEWEKKKKVQRDASSKWNFIISREEDEITHRRGEKRGGRVFRRGEARSEHTTVFHLP